MEAHVRTFLNYLRVEKGLSDNTIQAYRRDMAKFAAFAGKRGLGTAEVRREHVVDFLGSLYRRNLDSRSVARHLVTIRHFFRFSLTEGVIEDDPAANIESPKFRQSLPEFLSVEEVDRLLRQPDANDIVGIRDKAMIELMYSTGLRVSELCGLRISDLQMDPGCLRCIGKGNKERLVPVGHKALEAVQTYLREARKELSRGVASPYLFLNQKGHKLNRIAFWKILGEYGRKAGLAKVSDAAHAAPQLCNAPARSRRRPAIGADDAGPFRHFDDADLHACCGRTIETGVQGASSARLREIQTRNGGDRNPHARLYVFAGKPAIP